MLRSIFNKKFLTWFLSIALVSTAVWSYFNWISTTKVALVNYAGFQAARIIGSLDSDWITIDQLDKNATDSYGDYDVIYIFGRGLSLTPEQVAAFNEAGENGTRILVEASTNPQIDVTNLYASERTRVQDYFRYGGEFNYTQLIRYSRVKLDEKTFGVEAAQEPQEIDMDVLFHFDESKMFSTVANYLEYYKTLPQFSPEGKKIALMTSVPGPFNANRDHLDSLINELEGRGMQVYPIASFDRRLELIQEVDPDAVLMMPHGRLQLGSGSSTIQWLKQQNIPLLAPVSVFQNYEKWLDDPQGYTSNLLTMNIVMPEIDGATLPYAINAQFSDDNQLEIFKAIPDRLNTFTDVLERWFALKDQDNLSKKLAIVYFRGPGKNSLVAGNMEVIPSLFNTLHALKKDGYFLGELPDDIEEFKADINLQGTVMAPYAEGLLEQFYNEGNPALIPAAQYAEWCENSLAAGVCERVNNTYGPAPGNFMVTEKDGETYLAVARLQYGNVALLPQPLPGIGEDTFKLVHGTEKAPPHSYMAPYMWLKEVFEADAIMHYGTHGSLEFTQGKQVALSSYDWADVLIGDLPHFYVYTMSNVGEAIIAKRRSYATILSHLTPPFLESGLYSELRVLSDRIAEFAITEGTVQLELKDQINELIVSLELAQDLELSESQLQAELENWREEVLSPVSEWLETLAQSKITKGLYTLGNRYSEDETDQTALLMTLDAMFQSYQVISEEQSESALVDQQLREQVQNWINQRLTGTESDALMAELVDPSLLERTEVWIAENQGIDQGEMIRGFIAMSSDGSGEIVGRDLSEEELMDLTAKAMSDGETQEFLLGLENDQTFTDVSRALDPEVAEKAKLLAKVIPPIGKALAQLEKDDVRQVVIAMQTPETKEKVLGWVKSDDLAVRVAAQKEARLEAEYQQALTALPQVILRNEEVETDWQHLTHRLNFLESYKKTLIDQPELETKLSGDIAAQYQMSPIEFHVALSNTIEETGEELNNSRIHEAKIAQNVQLFKQAMENVTDYQSYLINGADYEFNAILNALGGGYTEPSTGGDPVRNPSALPTGRNMYSIDAETTPSVAAWDVGKRLADTLLEQHYQEQGEYPEKISFTLWPSEFIHTQGATIAEILYLLGVEPVRDPFGRVGGIRLIPLEQLGRPRIDVVLQSAGQLRDLAASRLALIEEAVVMAAEAEDNYEQNFVAKGVRDAEVYLLEKGVAPQKAREDSYRRSFGGINGAYGTAIMENVEQGDSWQTDQEIARQYLENMGAVYGDSGSWGDYQPHLFAAALQNTEVVIQPRSSNTWGALSLDHVYEFMGGLNLAVREVTGSDPKAYFNDFRNANQAKLQTLNEAVWTEMRTTLLNPTYISELSSGGASSAETFAETFRNTYGWNVMKPDAIDDSVWNRLHDVYIRDSENLDLQSFFERENPYALQEMSGVMLETARKGLWQASEEQLVELATIHAEMVAEYEAGCGNFTCGNEALQSFIVDQLAQNQSLLTEYQTQMTAALSDSNQGQGVVLKRQEVQPSAQTETPQNTEQVEQTAPQSAEATSGSSFNPLWLFLILIPISFMVMRRRNA